MTNMGPELITCICISPSFSHFQQGEKIARNLRKAISNSISIFDRIMRRGSRCPSAVRRPQIQWSEVCLTTRGNSAGLFLKRQCQPLPTMTNFHSHPQKSKAQKLPGSIKKTAKETFVSQHKPPCLKSRCSQPSTSNPFSITPFPQHIPNTKAQCEV